MQRLRHSDQYQTATIATIIMLVATATGNDSSQDSEGPQVRLEDVKPAGAVVARSETAENEASAESRDAEE